MADRCILITGASSGIGAAIAVALAEPGDRLILQYHRNHEGMDRVEMAVKAAGATSVRISVDLTAPDGRARCVEAVAELGVTVDILINNAGSPVMLKDWQECTEEDANQIFGLNFLAAFELCQRVFPGMCAAGHGRVVNISSIGVKYGGGSQTLLYSAAKASLELMTLNLAKAGAPYQVTVNTVRAGIIDTSFYTKFPGRLDDRVKLIPLGRAGKTSEVAAMVAHLVGPDGGFITGQTFTVSGGE